MIAMQNLTQFYAVIILLQLQIFSSDCSFDYPR